MLRIFRIVSGRTRAEAEINEELRAALAILTDRYAAAGLDPEQARRAALLEIGGIEQVKEKIRDARRGSSLEALVYDLRHGFRILRRDRAFSSLAVLTVALGIGVNAAVFSILYTVMLKPLPYQHPQDLAIIWSQFSQMGLQRAAGSGPELRELQNRTHLFSGITGIWVGSGVIGGGADPEQVKVAEVSTNFFDVFGARPAIGRGFTPADTAYPPKSAVISDSVWRRRFGADPHVLGKPLRLRNGAATIIGVMPPEFRLYFAADSHIPTDIPVFTPFGPWVPNGPADLYFIRFIGRLRPGVALPQAQADLDSVAHWLRSNYGEYAMENLGLHAFDLHDDTIRDLRPGVATLMTGAVFVLLIACVNVANLLLARGAARRKEIALRSAIGASGVRVVRQLLAESLALGLTAGLMGTAIAWACVRAMSLVVPDSLARLGPVSLSPQVLLFVLAVSLLCSILFGIVPALRARRVNLADSMRDTGHGVHKPAGAALRGALVMVEVMLGFVLLTCAGLMIMSFAKMHRASPGFDPSHVLTFELQPRGADTAAVINFVRERERALRSLPGVEAVGATSHLPLDDYPNWYSPYRPDGLSEQNGKGLMADHRAITHAGLLPRHVGAPRGGPLL
ncbi:MAG TPA: ABC transporter permease [Bryobacteraceae bacterium]|nr:ABC transporter permease [Bryobacteraceae bacterium]